MKELTDQELIEKAKKAKSSKITNAVIIGFMAGISVYSTVKNGFGFFTFLPVIFLPFVINSKKADRELQEELKSRNLK
ncbi:hypothetical protein [Chryseobacterium sp. Mn2064]|uniref:hypothetical protein n=1 Tax=Chryseobacterium sp. Mn2064 TaxID=3395263 RepID=UPI003BDBEFB2